jgi:hypothetical protein
LDSLAIGVVQADDLPSVHGRGAGDVHDCPRAQRVVPMIGSQRVPVEILIRFICSSAFRPALYTG